MWRSSWRPPGRPSARMWRCRSPSRVKNVAPGFTITEGVSELLATPGVDQMTVARRSIKRRQLPEDLIGAILFLSSEESDFITGQTLVVDGGVALH